MKVAITTWENRISPVFDSSHMLVIATIKDSRIIEKRSEPFNSKLPLRFVERLNELNVKFLICGAITMRSATVIEAGGIELVSFIGGVTDEVLEVFAKDTSIISKFLMPGCSRNRCIRRKNKECFGFTKKGGKYHAGKRRNRPIG